VIAIAGINDDARPRFPPWKMWCPLSYDHYWSYPRLQYVHLLPSIFLFFNFIYIITGYVFFGK
jgi:hypothetical protein